MNLIFTAFLTVSVVALLFINPDLAMSALIAGAENSVHFSVKLFCIYAVWLSVLHIWSELRFDRWLGDKLKFLLYRIFPKENETAYNHLSLNLSANMLGMGSAGTPAGIHAMENMTHRKNRIMLVVINSCSVQIIPTTILAMRSAAGATKDIVLPALISTFLSTFLGFLLVKLLVK